MDRESSGVKVDHLEKIEAFSKPPWEPIANTYIEEEAKAIAHALRPGSGQSQWFTAVSAKHQRIGIGVFNVHHEKHRIVASNQEANTYYGELAAIYDVVEITTQISVDNPPTQGNTTIVIYSSNQAALKSLTKPAQQSGQHMIARILMKLRHIRRAQGPDASLLAQVRTAKCRLNDYLAKIGAAVTNMCIQCGKPETVKHYLLQCHRWDDLRAELIAKAGNRASDLSFLLGGWTDAKDAKGNLINGNKEKWKPDCSVISATLSYIRRTGRLDTEEIDNA